MVTQAELGLAEADERIAEADRNIQRIASLLPDLAVNGDVSLEVERRLELMTRALWHLRAQRRSRRLCLAPLQTLMHRWANRHALGKAKTGELKVVAEWVVEVQGCLTGWTKPQRTLRRNTLGLEFCLPLQQLPRRHMEGEVRMSLAGRWLPGMLQK